MLENFIWGKGGQKLTPEQVAHQREIAEAARGRMGDTSPVGHWTQGATRVVDALSGVLSERRADEAEAAMKSEFDGVVESLIGTQGAKLASAYDSPYANGAHKEIIKALIGDLPRYAKGTNYHPGGKALVGELGPEIVELPEGAKVHPNPFSDPSRVDEFDTLTDEEKARVLRLLQEGMTPDEALAPEGYTPQDMLGPQSSILTPRKSSFLPGAEYKTADMSGIDPASLPYGDAKLTGDQSKAIAYYRRGFGANQTLSDPNLSSALTEWDDSFAGNFGALGRMYQSEDYQVGSRAAKEFLAAILRKDTGAAITSEEFELYGPMYLPQPGDKPATLEAKKRARNEALIAIQMGLGTAAPLAEMVQEELAPSSAGATHRFNPETGKIEAIK